MSAVETPRQGPSVLAVPAGGSDDGAAPRRRRGGRPGWLNGWTAAVAALLLGAFLLRIWGVRHGLPYAYNADENAHFVPRAIGLFGHDWNPGYFVNPPGFTYLLHALFAVWYGGREGVSSTFAADPTEVWVLSRALVAVLGTLGVWLLYLFGARLFDRRTGLLAAGLLAVAFLPVFYSHLALNDVPTLVPICLALWAAAGVLRHGRRRDYLLAGVGLGLAAATKYTGGIVLVPLLLAAAAQAAPGARGAVVRGLALAGVAALAAFLAANPYALLDFEAFREGLSHQSDASADTVGKLGLTHDNGYTYYLGAFGWGLGWVPLAAAAAGVVLLWRRDRPALAFLLLAPVAFVLFMGSQERYFGRWLLPVFPFVAVLAAAGAMALVDLVSARRPHLRPAILALAVVALGAQGLTYSLHSGLVLSRADTRNLAREWLVQNVPVGTKIVVEPGVVPDSWAQYPGNPSPVTRNGNRWIKYPTSRSRIDPRTGELLPRPGIVVNLEDFERVLRPELVPLFERQGYCWVVVGSTQRGRAEVEPDVVPGAIAYYRELERRGTVAFEASPFAAGRDPVEFSFDWTFNYYPLAYHRPGPIMTVFKLTGGRCAET
jgi:hypothetical protein